MYVYMCTACVGVQMRSTSLLEEEISQLKETIERLGYSLSTMEKEKLDLVNEVEVAKKTIKQQGYSLCTLENEKQDLVSDVGVAKAAVSPVCTHIVRYMYVVCY